MTQASNDDTDRRPRGSIVRSVARSATGPVRGYLNEHFEMVKDEVRRVGAAGGGGGSPDSVAWTRVAELESVLAEQSVHQARVLARVTDELAALTERIADLERVVRAFAEIVAPPTPD